MLRQTKLENKLRAQNLISSVLKLAIAGGVISAALFFLGVFPPLGIGFIGSVIFFATTGAVIGSSLGFLTGIINNNLLTNTLMTLPALGLLIAAPFIIGVPIAFPPFIPLAALAIIAVLGVMYMSRALVHNIKHRRADENIILAALTEGDEKVDLTISEENSNDVYLNGDEYQARRPAVSVERRSIEDVVVDPRLPASRAVYQSAASRHSVERVLPQATGRTPVYETTEGLRARRAAKEQEELTTNAQAARRLGTETAVRTETAPPGGQGYGNPLFVEVHKDVVYDRTSGATAGATAVRHALPLDEDAFDNRGTPGVSKAGTPGVSKA